MKNFDNYGIERVLPFNNIYMKKNNHADIYGNIGTYFCFKHDYNRISFIISNEAINKFKKLNTNEKLIIYKYDKGKVTQLSSDDFCKIFFDPYTLDCQQFLDNLKIELCVNCTTDKKYWGFEINSQSYLLFGVGIGIKEATKILLQRFDKYAAVEKGEPELYHCVYSYDLDSTNTFIDSFVKYLGYCRTEAYYTDRTKPNPKEFLKYFSLDSKIKPIPFTSMIGFSDTKSRLYKLPKENIQNIKNELVKYEKEYIQKLEELQKLMIESNNTIDKLIKDGKILKHEYFTEREKQLVRKYEDLKIEIQELSKTLAGYCNRDKLPNYINIIECICTYNAANAIDVYFCNKFPIICKNLELNKEVEDEVKNLDEKTLKFVKRCVKSLPDKAIKLESFILDLYGINDITTIDTKQLSYIKEDFNKYKSNIINQITQKARKLNSALTELCVESIFNNTLNETTPKKEKK